jgi:hypothetical protein
MAPRQSLLVVFISRFDLDLGRSRRRYALQRLSVLRAGDQKSARYQTVDIGKKLGGLFDVYPDWRAINPVAGPCPAGSAVFHNGLTAHGAGANMTNKPRRAMTCAYMPDGSTFNGTPNILPKAYFESLKVGDVLNDDTINPLIWHA